MNSKLRQNVLVLILVVIALAYVARNELGTESSGSYAENNRNDKVNKVLEIDNFVEINRVDVSSSYTQLELSYSYNGELGNRVYLLIEPDFDNVDDIISSDKMISWRKVKLGERKEVVYMNNPCSPLVKCIASKVRISFVKESQRNEIVHGNQDNEIQRHHSHVFAKTISWEPRTENLVKQSPIGELNVAIGILNGGDRRTLGLAKNILDKIIINEPDNLQAYVELARYHMKASWGKAGLKRAEDILNAAYAKDKEYANTLILRGYVYTHLQKYDLAEKDFRRAEKLGTDNLWLTANWGEYHQLQGNVEAAIDYYRVAIDKKENTASPNIRAKIAAFDRTMSILYEQGKFQRIDNLLMNKTQQFPKRACYLSDWAEFKLLTLGDFLEAKKLAFKAVMSQCSNEKYSKRVYSDTLVADWFYKGENNKDGSRSFYQAVALDANWPQRIYRFAASQKMQPIVKKLVERELDISQVDTDGYSALAHAVLNNDSKAVSYLIELGANPNQILADGYSIFYLAAISSKRNVVEAFINSNYNLKVNLNTALSIEDILRKRGFDDLVNKLNQAI